MNKRAVELLSKFKSVEGNGVGGTLHIILDDLNVEDRNVWWCLEYAKSKGDELGAELAREMVAMSKTQRLKLCRMFNE